MMQRIEIGDVGKLFRGITSARQILGRKVLTFTNSIVAYVDSIRRLAEKELLSNDTILKLTRYVTSFDDVIRGQNLDTFMHNPLNVYKIIRHAVVGWPIVERSLKVVEIFSRLLIFHLVKC